MIYNIIIGTAGHIDHGKSLLVKNLTGVDPDRLKEEKARGMTIDLGFAPFVLDDGTRVGIIDVPGHERFIKNMVAGSTGIDFVILVIAADDGVMPQTREHLEITELLGVKEGLVVLTKIDRVDEELLELVEEDVISFVGSTILADKPIIRVSNVTGEGIDTLRIELNKAIRKTTPNIREGSFRMPIQRVFPMAGYGTVITGVPISGMISPGEAVEAYPKGIKGNVRRIQAYGTEISRATSGHSTALNVNNIKVGNVRRGDVLGAPDSFYTSRFIVGRMSASGYLQNPLKNGMSIRFHTGTSEVIGRLILLEGNNLQPGDNALVQFNLNEEILAICGDRFIVRNQSPMVTLGGGNVVNAANRKTKRFRKHILMNVRKMERYMFDYPKTLEHLLIVENSPLHVESIRKRLGITNNMLNAALMVLKGENKIINIPNTTLVIHPAVFECLIEKTMKSIESFFLKSRLDLAMDTSKLKSRLGTPLPLLNMILARLKEEGRISVEENRVSIAGRFLQLTSKEREGLKNIEKHFLDGSLSPPSLKEIPEMVKLDKRTMEGLVDVLVKEGKLIRVQAGLFFHQRHYEEAVISLKREIKEKGPLTVSEIRKLLNSSRKYVVPLLEYLDSRKITKREGDRRTILD